MTEREEFRFDKGQLGTNGIGLILIGLGLMGLVFGTQRWEDNAPIIVLSVVLGVPMIVLGLIELNKRGRTGVQVVVDGDGITDVRLGPDPILWDDVARCEWGRGQRGASWVCLRLRPGSPAAARLRKASVRINDRILTHGSPGLRNAIARLAPQVPRDW